MQVYALNMSVNSINRQIHYAKKSFLRVYIGMCDCYENIKIKLWSTISILKAWHVEIFCYKKKMIVKFNYVL